MPVSAPAGLPRHLTGLAVKITPNGELRLRLHSGNRVTWFIGESHVDTPQATTALLEDWAVRPRIGVDPTPWSRARGELLPIPEKSWAPPLWDPPAALREVFEAAFVARPPSHEAARALGSALGAELADFLARSRAAARAELANGWAERAQVRLAALRRVVQPAQQARAGVLASEVATELRAVGFMALAPEASARRLYHELQAERQSLYGWEQALARLGISARRGSGAYP